MAKPRVRQANGELTLDVAEAPAEFVAQLRHVTSKKQRMILRKNGRAVAAVIPIRELRLLERVWEQLEDESDIAYSYRVLADPTQIPEPWEEVKARLRL